MRVWFMGQIHIKEANFYKVHDRLHLFCFEIKNVKKKNIFKNIIFHFSRVKNIVLLATKENYKKIL